MTALDMRHLRYFVGIADCGSLMKASERLHVAQPALSVHVKGLEIDLGVKLMHRSHRGIQLTPEGMELYERAKFLLKYFQDTVDIVKSRGSLPSGTVSIGMPSTCSHLLAADIYRRVSDELPGVTVYIADASTAVLYEWLLDGRMDFAVLFSVPEDANLDCVPLRVEEFCLVGRPDTLDDRDCFDFEKIFDRPLVLSCQSTTWRKILDDAAEKHGKTLKAAIETESVSVIKAIAMSGQAGGLLPMSCVQEEIANGSLRAQRLVNPEIRGLLSLVSLPSLQANPAKTAVRDLVINIVEESRGYWGKDSSLRTVTPILRAVPTKVLPIDSGRRRSESSGRSVTIAAPQSYLPS